MKETSPYPKKPGRWRRILVGLLLALVLAPLVGFLVLQTGAGREWLANRLSSALSTEERTVRVEQVRVPSLTRVSVGSMSVADSDGGWLGLRNLEIGWKPLSLLSDRIEIGRVHVGSLDVARRPASEDRASSRGVSSPLRVPEFLVESLSLGEVRMQSPVLGFPVTVTDVHGRVQGGSRAMEADNDGLASLKLHAAAGRVELGTTALEPVEADIDLFATRVRWGLSTLALSGEGWRVSGGLDFAGEGAWPTGHLHAAGDLAAGWARGLWPDGSAGKIDVELEGAPGPDEHEVVQAKITVENLAGDGLTVQAATAQAQWQRLRAQPDVLVQAEAQLAGLTAGGRTVTGAMLRVWGPWQALEMAGTAGGTLEQPFVMDAAGSLRWGDAGWDLELSNGTLGWGGVPVRLEEPLKIRAARGETAIRAVFGVDAFDLASASNAAYGALNGRITAGLRVRGTLAAPAFDGRAAFEGVASQRPDLADLPGVSGSFDVGYSNGMLRASARANLATGEVARAHAEVPLGISLRPPALRLDRDRPLTAAVEAGLGLAVLNGLDAFANGRIDGRIDLSVAHVGTLAGGTVTGACVLAGGEYENHVLGTVIRKAGARLVARDDRLVVESGSATDGGDGRLTLAGSVRLALNEGLPYALEVGCRRVSLLRRPDAAVTVSGKLGVTGDVSRVSAVGDIRIDDARVQLQNIRPSAPAGLEPKPAVGLAAARLGGTNVTVRLGVDVPGTLYVRGRSLDSAWAGHLVLEYANGTPGVTGYLEPRRGTVLLMKRPFKLTDGRIVFNGGWPPSPAVRLTAEFSRADLTARVGVVGNMNNPVITLTSDPALPEDEIIARILFGRNASTITPLQALSLASEATKLRQLGGGTGVLGDLQAAVGIDRVEIREAGAGSSSPEVAVGKYLGARSYVEMRRATSSDPSSHVRVFLEHELSPSIAIEADSGLDMRSGIGVFWKRDY